jgi:hypothetical protein
VTLSRVTRQQEFTRSDLQKRVAEEQPDGLCLLVEVGGHGAFVAAFRNRVEIVLAHVNRQSPKPATRPFSLGSHSLSRCNHGGLSLGRVDGARKPFPRRERLDGHYTGYRVGMGQGGEWAMQGRPAGA